MNLSIINLELCLLDIRNEDINNMQELKKLRICNLYCGIGYNQRVKEAKEKAKGILKNLK